MAGQSRSKKVHISSSTRTPPPTAINKFLTSITTSGTPASVKNSSFQDILETARRKKLMAKETIGHWAGPCPISELLDECMPLAEGDELPTDFAPDYFKDKPVHSEADLSKLLCNLINGAEDGASPLFQAWMLVDTSNHKDKTAGEATRVDLKLVQSSKYDPTHRNNKGITEMDFELKVRRSDAFNENPGEKLEENLDVLAPMEATTGAETRGQLAMYASDICSRQHRTHLFMLYFFHPYVRILRWDRSGVIVTERFNYVTDCTPLVHYLYRFTRLDAAARGFDPTVTVASETEAEVARKLLKRWEPKHPRDVLKVAVPNGNKTEYFLIWGAIAEPRSPFGRGTRGYPAVQVLPRNKYSKPMFLKEQWRAASVGSEVDTLKKLKKAKIKHVPTLICGGDFHEHTTLSDKFAKAEWKLRGVDLDARTLTRLVVAEVGTPLSQFPNSKTLIQVIFDAFVGHQGAYSKCKILHRDVSAGNILIIDGGRGMLSDWDLAKEVSKLGDVGRTHDRTGTWAFMSVQLSKQPSKVHTVQDDIESFFWVVVYHAIRYSLHDQADVSTLIRKLFDECFMDGPQATGGTQKSMLINESNLDGRRLNFECVPLTSFVFKFRTHLEDLAREHTRKLREEEAKAISERERKNSSKPPKNVSGRSLRNDAGPSESSSSSTNVIDKKAHSTVSKLFKDALASTWPKSDKAVDYYQLQLDEAHKTFVPAQPRTMNSTSKSHPHPFNLAGPSKSRSSQKRSYAEFGGEADQDGDEQEQEEEPVTKPKKSKKRARKSRG
ncbi:hypothetical protein ONZ45_g15614 [Pleurotus djamor]|nr:hypothetical protein ONZ45_g15614 [Pleurotus djamor]